MIPKVFSRLQDFESHLSRMWLNGQKETREKKEKNIKKKSWSEFDTSASWCVNKGHFNGKPQDERGSCWNKVLYEAFQLGDRLSQQQSHICYIFWFSLKTIPSALRHDSKYLWALQRTTEGSLRQWNDPSLHCRRFWKVAIILPDSKEIPKERTNTAWF